MFPAAMAGVGLIVIVVILMAGCAASGQTAEANILTSEKPLVQVEDSGKKA